MENQENIAGLGKNHDEAAHNHDLAKKQSEAKPAAENLEMEPHSVDKSGDREFSGHAKEIHDKAAAYAKHEHEKADSWENNNDNGPDAPQF
ncbi:MAG: hypothetical protein REI78_05155 [Pedobacter sp.]|nr:hypothetical protein [Pedobacter sp.]MDQ8052387.1 hypothetical protein [Pedobacter sp.]